MFRIIILIVAIFLSTILKFLENEWINFSFYFLRLQFVLNKFELSRSKRKKEEEEERDFTTIIHAQFTPVIASLSTHDHDKEELN